ncbi:O-antigen ligase family protein [uncultured Jatrophihabitans sp.]|uniref:O-antigen ligase family protein n=1 Tax=uncultured Jatrophihabitans sp. TaxID=1610747 RepID=UPI0035CB7C87
MFLLALFWTFSLTPISRLRVLGWINILQWRVPALLQTTTQGAFTVLFLPAALMNCRAALRIPVVRLVAALALIDALVIGFSPSVGEGIRGTLPVINLFVALVFAHQLWAAGRNPLTAVMTSLSPLVVLSAISTIVFRLSPAIEHSYLTSWLGGRLLGQGATLIYTTLPNNVVLSYKAGGVFFVNGNQAALFHGVCLLAYSACAFHGRRRLCTAMAVLCATAVVATGSNTGILLLILVPIALVVLRQIVRSRIRLVWLSLGTVVVIGGVALVASVLSLLSGGQDTATGRINDADDTFAVRERIWGVGRHLFDAHPLSGLGWGGWSRSFAEAPEFTQFVRVFPPHNLIIAAWSDSSLLGAFVLVVIIVTLLVQGLRRLPSRLGTPDEWPTLLVIGMVIWITAHGMGDNTFVYGTEHTTVIYAAAIIVLLCGRPPLVVDSAAGALPNKSDSPRGLSEKIPRGPKPGRVPAVATDYRGANARSR